MDSCGERDGTGLSVGKDRIIVSCVTFETAKVVEPIKHYGATKAHLIYYVKDENNPAYSVYSEFVQEVRRQLMDDVGLDDDSIIIHRLPVYSFKHMMREVYRILKDERQRYGDDCEIFVNVSSGTSEYTAAATIASMMIPEVTPFTVSTKDFLIPSDRIREIYYEGGVPVGMSKNVYSPLALQKYPMEAPPEDLVKALKVFHDRASAGKPISHVWMIRGLIEQGSWREGGEAQIPEGGVKKITVSQSMKMYYIRHYLNKWCERGWMEKEGVKHRLTDAGKNIVEMFPPTE